MITQTWLIYGAALPAGIALLVTLLFALIRAKQPGSRAIDVGVAVAVGAAFVVGYQHVSGWPAWPPGAHTEAREWLVLAIAPAAVLTALLAALPGRAAVLGWIARILTAVAVIPLLVQTFIRHDWALLQAVTQLDGPIALLGAVWLATAGLARRQPSVSLPLSLMLVAGATGLTIMLSGSNTVGQPALSLAAGLAAVSLIGLLWRGRHGAAGAIDGAWPVTAGLIVIGVVFSELDLINALLLGAAPLLAWVGELPTLKQRKPWQRGLVQLLLVAVPLAVALARAMMTFQSEMEASGYA